MADNVAITAGSGTNIAADDVSSVFYQKVKIDAGGDGATTPVLAGGGVEASALRVTIASDSTGVLSIDDNGGSITIDGTVATALDGAGVVLGLDTYTEAATVGVGIAAVRRDADTTLVNTTNEFGPLQMDANGRLKVEAFSGEVLPVSDNGGALTVDNGGTFAVQVDAAIPAGTNNIGDVDIASIAAGDNNIGNVDIVTMPAVTNGGTFAVQVDGAALTALQLIDDIVYTDDTSTHATGTSKGALMMAAAVPTDTSVTANDIGAVAMTTDRKLHVSVQDALPAGTANIGDVDILTIAAGDNNIGNVDIVSQIPGTGATNLGKAEDAGHASGDTGVAVWGVRVDTPNTALTNTDADYSAIAVNKTGAVRVAPIEDDFAVTGSNHVKKYYTNAGAVTDGIVWSPAAGKRWYITSIFINVSAAATVTLEDDLAGGDAAIWKAELAANSGWSSTFPVPWFSGEDAADLIVTTSAGNVYITIVGYEI